MGDQLTIYQLLDSRPGINPKHRLAIRTGMIGRKEKQLPTFAPSWPDSLGVRAMLARQNCRKAAEFLILRIDGDWRRMLVCRGHVRARRETH